MDSFDLKAERLRARIPQWKLAQALGVNPTTLCAVENGRLPLEPDTERRIINAIRELGGATARAG